MSNAALISQRAAGLPGNPFAEADARAAAAIAAGEDVIDLSKGNPDGQPPAFVQDALAHAAHDPSLFRYPSFDGLPEYLNAIAGWYESKHGVSVDPATQLLATSGSSVGIATVIQALIDPGRRLLLSILITRNMKVPRRLPEVDSRRFPPIRRVVSCLIWMLLIRLCGNVRSC